MYFIVLGKRIHFLKLFQRRRTVISPNASSLDPPQTRVPLSPSNDHRSYRVDRMRGATVTSQVFRPRYTVELTSTGPLPIRPTSPRMATTSRASSSYQGPIYVFRCPYCHKTFNRRTMDSHLNPHKDRHGYQCPGRVGGYVRTTY
jgi:hypothetical protein